MDTLNIIFGVVGLISFVFSIYTYYKTESRKMIEAAKAAMIKERFRNIRLSLLGIYNNVDSIIQIPKRSKTSVEHLQHIARLARAQIMVLTSQVELEQKRLEEWKYGKMIDSDIQDQLQFRGKKKVGDVPVNKEIEKKP